MDLPNNIHIKEIANILTKSGEHVEGNLICDINPYHYSIHKNFAKIKNIQHICKNKTKICEIGVNACHSLLLMLMVNPHAEYVLFDLNWHKYTDPCIQYIMTQFPDTHISVYYGNSVETIKQYIENNNTYMSSFDMCHVDGGTSLDVFPHDYANINKLLSKKGCVAFDHYDYGDIKSFLDAKVLDKEIKPVIDAELLDTSGHFIYSLC